jgi:hypothetical protein
MPTSLPLSSKRSRPVATTDLRYWCLLALPVAGLALAVLSTSVFTVGASSAILEVARTAI